MVRIATSVGSVLVGLSALSVIRTAREVRLWEFGNRKYVEEYSQTRSINFAGHTFTYSDDQPTDTVARGQC